MQDELAWSHVIEVAALPSEGRSVELVADEATRKRLAEAAHVNAVRSLTVKLEVRPVASDGVAVTGRIEGKVLQTCVVSLEEFENPVAEDIAVDFAAEPEQGEEGESEEEDLPDSIVDGKIDLGALATEFLILAIDPYPRKPGVAFEAPVVDEAEPEAKPNPFEQLSALKDRIKKQ
jgi:uncharacterized metal-binding protein YceD (DUF177 family)